MKSLAIALFVSLVASSTGAAAEKLNVLFIAIDDLRPELHCYGNTLIQSPNIDALAARSLQFNRAYCQLALCNPSRSSFLSGRRPETLHVFDLKTFLRDGNPDLVTLPELFKNNGYTSLSFGKIFHTGNGNHEDPQSWSEKAWKPRPEPSTQPGRAPQEAGNEDPHADDLPYETPNVDDSKLADGQTADAVIEALRKNKDKPFFIGCGFHKPHMPFVAPRKYWDMYDGNAIKLAPNQNPPTGAPEFASNNASELRRYFGVPKTGPIPEDIQRNLIHAYFACVTYVDAQIGKVLDELDKQGLRKKTIVVLLGDHGYQLGEHGTWNKRTNWEIATRVPLLISMPGAKGNSQKTDALAELVDLYPTLAAACGLALPDKLEGKDLSALLSNPNTPWKKAAFSVYEKNVKGMGQTLGRAMRTDRYRFIEWSGKTSDKKVYELYDEQTDPMENTNLADLPENKPLVDELKQRLDAGWKGALPQ
jgi:arylsulfatase A-like enzyme